MGEMCSYPEESTFESEGHDGMSVCKRYWELHGKRRPFPPLYEAAKMYGSENVFFDKPQYEKPRQCPWCGGEVKNKRRRFCSDQCRAQFDNLTVWNRGRDPPIFAPHFVPGQLQLSGLRRVPRLYQQARHGDTH